MFGNLVPPDEVIESVVKSVRSMKYNGYAPSTGTPHLSKNQLGYQITA